MGTSTDSSQVDVVSLEGKLDASVAPSVRDDLKGRIASGSVRLVVDLSAVTFIDSSGLSALVATYKAAREAGGEVALAGLDARVRSIFELTRLHHVFEIFDDAESARSDLARSDPARSDPAGR